MSGMCLDSKMEFLMISYLAATVLIKPDSELFILCANSLKKAFLAKNKVGPISY